jgi:hypothetical protein
MNSSEETALCSATCAFTIKVMMNTLMMLSDVITLLSDKVLFPLATTLSGACSVRGQ